MAEARHHQKRLDAMGIVIKIEIHLERCGNCGKTIAQFIQKHALLGNEADAHEKAPRIQIVELGAIDDVATLAGKITRNSGNDTAGGLASDSQDKVKHQSSSISRASAKTLLRA
ncbi:Uncharacterised protein [Brucella suis]|nr:Uncharacterised protein [Brucella suis]